MWPTRFLSNASPKTKQRQENKTKAASPNQLTWQNSFEKFTREVVANAKKNPSDSMENVAMMMTAVAEGLEVPNTSHLIKIYGNKIVQWEGVVGGTQAVSDKSTQTLRILIQPTDSTDGSVHFLWVYAKRDQADSWKILETNTRVKFTGRVVGVVSDCTPSSEQDKGCGTITTLYDATIINSAKKITFQDGCIAKNDLGVSSRSIALTQMCEPLVSRFDIL